MREMLQFYIDGQWVDPVTANPFEVINPATEEICGHISLGSEADVDKAAERHHCLPAFVTETQHSRKLISGCRVHDCLRIAGIVGLPDEFEISYIVADQYIPGTDNVLNFRDNFDRILLWPRPEQLC